MEWGFRNYVEISSSNDANYNNIFGGTKCKCKNTNMDNNKEKDDDILMMMMIMHDLGWNLLQNN